MIQKVQAIFFLPFAAAAHRAGRGALALVAVGEDVVLGVFGTVILIAQLHFLPRGEHNAFYY